MRKTKRILTVEVTSLSELMFVIAKRQSTDSRVQLLAGNIISKSIFTFYIDLFITNCNQISVALINSNAMVVKIPVFVLYILENVISLFLRSRLCNDRSEIFP